MKPIREQSEQDLIHLIKKQDKTAFRALFDRYYPSLLGTGINLLKDKEVAKDVVQDVFLQIWKNREKLQINTSLEAYLKRAVINRSLNKIRSRKGNTGTEELKYEQVNEPSAQEELEGGDVKKALDRGLRKLPERCRLIFTLKRIEGMSQKEIASQLDISTKTIENQMTKALKVLKEELRPFLKNRE